MVSVTMAANPPPYNADTGIVIFDGGRGQREQIHAYYEAHFRTGPHMSPIETFAQFALEKGYGAYAPRLVKNERGEMVRETWQACGRRLFGERFVGVMERVVTEYRAQHGATPPRASAPLPEPPAHVLEPVPEPEF
jgi:hypothetical protein